ncbi:MAG: hypothetical protein WD768_21040 [Phycisphaeraceae bacterium]
MAWRKPTNLNEWLGIVLRHKKKFFYPAITVMIVFIWASQYMAREYWAEAKFQRRSDSNSADSNVVPDTYRRIQQMMQYNFKGRPAIVQLIKDLNLDQGPKYPRMEDNELTLDGKRAYNELIAELTNSVRVSHQVNSEQVELISVSFTHMDRELTPKVPDKLVENYLRQVRKELDETLLEQKKFFDNEVTRYGRKVQELEQNRQRFMVKEGGIEPDDPMNVHTKLKDMKESREEKRAAYEKAKGGLTELIKWEQEQPDFIESKKQSENEQLKVLKETESRLAELLDYHLYELRRTEEHPAVKDTRRRLNKVRADIAAFSGPDKVDIEEVPNVEKLQAQKEIREQVGKLEASEKELVKLDEQIERYEVLNRNFFVVRNEYLKITRELEDSQDQLKFWTENLQKTQLSLTFAVSEKGMRLSIMQRAIDPDKPSSPALSKILAMALMLGLATGGLMIILAELLDHSYRSVEQAIDEIKLPVLGAVNEIVSPAAATRRKILGWGVFPLVTTVLALLLGGVFYLTYLSLEYPDKYNALRKSPVEFIKSQLTGSPY